MMNRHHPSCVCLQEVMLENNNYNLGREYEFYAAVPLGLRSKGGTAIAVRKDIHHNRLNLRTTLQVVALEICLVGRGKRTLCSIYLPPTEQVTEQELIDLLEQLPAPLILLGDFNAHNPLWGSEKMSTRGRILENILDKFNLLCLNEKEETYYRAFDGIKSTIDLTLTSITIAPEYRWSKEYELKGSDHFPIFLEDEREISIKQQQRWNIGRANWMQF